jgi:thioester reductase-like protein
MQLTPQDSSSFLCRTNYLGTQQLLELSSQMPRLKSFVHVSSSFVNHHLPRNTLIYETLYPLDLQGNPAAQELVQQLMWNSREEANALAANIMTK